MKIDKNNLPHNVTEDDIQKLKDKAMNYVEFTDNNYQRNSIKGWECPKCGAVMSPYTSVCHNCRGDYSVRETWTIPWIYQPINSPNITM